MTDPASGAGQAAADSGIVVRGNTITAGTTAHAPESTAGISVSNGQTTGNGPDAGATESFFDPASIQDKPELLAAYKQMQSSYTKRMQSIAANRQKLEMYERFEKDPLGTLQQLVPQYGYQLVQRGQDQPTDQEFKSWDDVKKHFFDEFKKEMSPVFNEVRALKKQNVESHLDSHFPDWRTYEDEMKANLQAHPSLVGDPDKLYRISVPAEVWEARATAKAMQKLRGSQEHAQVSGPTTTKQTTQAPTGPLSFDQAVEVARRRAAAEGLRRPS